MSDMFDYLKWRGDLTFTQCALNEVDALIFSTLSYIWYDGIVPETMEEGIELQEAAKQFLALSGHENMCRVKSDPKLLEEAAGTTRFGKTRLTFYRSIFGEKEETQFAAITALLDDGTALLIFRGTDLTLTGWKEDFNMAFYESVPAQLEAEKYVKEFAEHSNRTFSMTGHSKGGNLAVYAAVKCEEKIKQRIHQIYNQDGPGFTEYIMEDPGYGEMVPKIRTYIPQSSVVGMLLDHEEPYMVVKSKQIGPLQHDPYSWVLSGPKFVFMEEVSAGSKKINKTMKKWLAAMSLEERELFVDTIYEILTENGASQVMDLLHPKNVSSFMKALTDEKKRHILSTEMISLMHAVKKSREEEDSEGTGRGKKNS